MNSRVKLRHLNCLVVVAQERSMLKAAHLLALTQPAISKTVLELETIIGRPLLVRHARGVELTTAGQIMVNYASASLRTLREGLDAAGAQPHARQLSVSLGVLPTVSGSLLPAAMDALRVSVPSLHVRVAGGTNAQLMVRLRQGELELVFGRLAEPSEMVDLEFEHLFSERLVAVARTGHPLVGRRKVRPSALSDFPLVLPASGTAIRRTLDAFLVAHRVAMPACVIDTLDTVFAMQFVQRSDSIWFLPEGLVPGLAPLQLPILRLDTREMAGPVGITTRRDWQLSVGAETLAAAFRASTSAKQEKLLRIRQGKP